MFSSGDADARSASEKPKFLGRSSSSSFLKRDIRYGRADRDTSRYHLTPPKKDLCPASTSPSFSRSGSSVSNGSFCSKGRPLVPPTEHGKSGREVSLKSPRYSSSPDMDRRSKESDFRGPSDSAADRRAALSPGVQFHQVSETLKHSNYGAHSDWDAREQTRFKSDPTTSTCSLPKLASPRDCTFGDRGMGGGIDRYGSGFNRDFGGSRDGRLSFSGWDRGLNATFSSRSSMFSHSRSFKGSPSYAVESSRTEILPMRSLALVDVEFDDFDCISPRKKPRLAWGQGLAKYEKEKIKEDGHAMQQGEQNEKVQIDMEGKVKIEEDGLAIQQDEQNEKAHMDMEGKVKIEEDAHAILKDEQNKKAQIAMEVENVEIKEGGHAIQKNEQNEKAQLAMEMEKVGFKEDGQAVQKDEQNEKAQKALEEDKHGEAMPEKEEKLMQEEKVYGVMQKDEVAVDNFGGNDCCPTMLIGRGSTHQSKLASLVPAEEGHCLTGVLCVSCNSKEAFHKGELFDTYGPSLVTSSASLGAAGTSILEEVQSFLQAFVGDTSYLCKPVLMQQIEKLELEINLAEKEIAKLEPVHLVSTPFVVNDVKTCLPSSLVLTSEAPDAEDGDSQLGGILVGMLIEEPLNMVVLHEGIESGGYHGCSEEPASTGEVDCHTDEIDEMECNRERQHDNLVAAGQAAMHYLLFANQEGAKKSFECLLHLLRDGAQTVNGNGDATYKANDVKSSRNHDGITKKFLEMKISEEKKYLKFKEQLLAFKYQLFRDSWKQGNPFCDRWNNGTELHKVQSRNDVSLHQWLSVSQLMGPDSCDIRKKVCLLGPKRAHLEMPPMLLNGKDRAAHIFISKNGLVEDPLAAEHERKVINPWSVEENKVFLEKFSLFGKDFKKISFFLEHKTMADCVEFYYRNHKCEEFDKLHRKHKLKRRRECFRLGSSYMRTMMSCRSRQHEENSVCGTGLSLVAAAATMSIGEGSRSFFQASGRTSSISEVPKRCAQSYSFEGLLKEVDSPWTDIERDKFTAAVAMFGKDFHKIFQHVGSKSQRQCRMFFSKSRKRLGLDYLADCAASHEGEQCGCEINNWISDKDGNCLTSSGRSVGSMLPSSLSVQEHSSKIQPTPRKERSAKLTGSKTRREPTLWSPEEKETFLKTIKHYGRDWARLHERLPSKSLTQIKTYFQNSKAKLGLILEDSIDTGGTKRGHKGEDKSNMVNGAAPHCSFSHRTGEVIMTTNVHAQPDVELSLQSDIILGGSRFNRVDFGRPSQPRHDAQAGSSFIDPAMCAVQDVVRQPLSQLSDTFTQNRLKSEFFSLQFKLPAQHHVDEQSGKVHNQQAQLQRLRIPAESNRLCMLGTHPQDHTQHLGEDEVALEEAAQQATLDESQQAASQDSHLKSQEFGALACDVKLFGQTFLSQQSSSLQQQTCNSFTNEDIAFTDDSSAGSTISKDVATDADICCLTNEGGMPQNERSSSNLLAGGENTSDIKKAESLPDDKNKSSDLDKLWAALSGVQVSAPHIVDALVALAEWRLQNPNNSINDFLSQSWEALCRDPNS